MICAPLIRVLGGGSGVTRRLARENALRNPRRTAATASALMIGMTLVSAVTVLAASMTASAERQLDTGLTADFRVTPKSSVTSLSDKVVTAVAAAPGVRSAVAIRTAPLLLGGQTVSATAGEPARLLALHRLTLLEGSAALKRDELVVSQSTARSHGWRLGSVVPGEYQDGEKAGLRIAGIFGDVPDLLEAVPDLIVGVDTFRAHYPERVDRIDVLANPEAAQSLQSALTPWPNVSLKDREGIKEQYGADIRLLLQVVLGLLALSVLIAALGIVNTLALSVLERTREIGLLRAIGLGRRELRRMVRTEAVLISTAGALIGLVLGTCFAMVVQRAAAGDGMAVLSVPLVRLALYLLAGVLIGAVAAWGPARRAARMDVLRAISSP